jgi:hypothetical protein
LEILAVSALHALRIEKREDWRKHVSEAFVAVLAKVQFGLDLNGSSKMLPTLYRGCHHGHSPQNTITRTLSNLEMRVFSKYDPHYTGCLELASVETESAVKDVLVFVDLEMRRVLKVDRVTKTLWG